MATIKQENNYASLIKYAMDSHGHLIYVPSPVEPRDMIHPKET